MKFSILLIALCVSTITFGQHKRNYTGLNRFIPNGFDIGLKANQNYYFSSLKAEQGTATSASVEGSEHPGAGFGFYGHFYLSDKVGIQTEFNTHFRSGYVITNRVYQQDTMRTIYNEEVTNHSAVFFEIPVYLKFRWEFTPIRKGSWKADSRLGLFVGPRFTLTPFSNSTLSRSVITDSYDNMSQSITNNANSLGSVNKFFGVGAAIGVDYEIWQGFMVHAAYFRGFLSYLSKETGARALENRLEVGIGYRFN